MIQIVLSKHFLWMYCYDANKKMSLSMQAKNDVMSIAQTRVKHYEKGVVWYLLFYKT